MPTIDNGLEWTTLITAAAAGVSINLISSWIWDATGGWFQFGASGIRGFWVGKVVYTANSNRIAYNVYRITGRDSHLKIYAEHYDTKFAEVYIYKGYGVFNNGVLSFAIASTGKNRQRTSVMTLKIEQRHTQELSLSGLFADIDEQKGDFQRLFRGIALVEPFRISRIRLSRSAQLSRLWRRSYFETVEQVGGLLGRPLT